MSEKRMASRSALHSLRAPKQLQLNRAALATMIPSGFASQKIGINVQRVYLVPLTLALVRPAV